MNQDINSVVVPDEKKSHKNLRYRLSSIKTLWHKFEAENYDKEISYAQFWRYVSENIIKPKPEDWGACLCMTCMNPEFKLSCIKKTLPNINLTIEDLSEVTVQIVKTNWKNCTPKLKHVKKSLSTWSGQKKKHLGQSLHFTTPTKILVL